MDFEKQIEINTTSNKKTAANSLAISFLNVFELILQNYL